MLDNRCIFNQKDSDLYVTLGVQRGSEDCYSGAHITFLHDQQSKFVDGGIMTTRSKAAIPPSSNPSLPPSVRTQNKKKRELFPGDPRFEIALSVTDEDVRNLRENRMLRTHLLDFLIQQAAPTATSKDNSDPNEGSTYRAGLGVKHYIQESDILLSDMHEATCQEDSTYPRIGLYHCNEQAICHNFSDH